jgi:hypothetical protein
MISRRTFLLAAGLAAALAASAGPAWIGGAPAARAADGEKDDGKGEGKGRKGRDGEKKGGKDGGKEGEKDGDGGGKKDAKDEPKDPKDTPEGKECLAIGGEFERRDAAALAARVRPKGKVRINLSGTAAEYGRDQASAVLDEWFREKEVTKVVLRSVKDLQGELTVTWRARGSDRSERKTLLVTIEKRDKGEGYWLTRLELL